MSLLIIEDDQEIAELERDYFSLAGIDSTIAPDGERGLELALSGRWDAVVLDLMLPGLDGFEVLKRIRGERDFPVIVVSARSSDGDKVKALGLDADDFVAKPFSPAELVARVKAHVRRTERLSRSRSGAVAAFGRLRVDFERRTAEAAGESVALTASEWALLETLASNPGRVFSKDELFSSLRGEETYGDRSAIAVHVRRLREKIERDPSEPEIVETVWGLGYRLRA
jgi:DNA-binding response OmpR family regulator